MLIGHATHKSTAYPGDLRRVQGEVLLLYHLDANRGELVQPLTATALSSAGSDPFHRLCLVPDSDLPELDACFELLGQVPDVRAEIHSLFRCEVQEELFSVEKVLYIDQLHRQVMVSEKDSRFHQNLVLFLPLLGRQAQILSRGQSGQRYFLKARLSSLDLIVRGIIVAGRSITRLLLRGQSPSQQGHLGSPHRLDHDPGTF